MKSTDSVCPGCATGCSIRIQHNKGVIYRLLPRENEAVNQSWMCDEGRTTYMPVNAENRLRTPFARTERGLEVVRLSEAVRRFQGLFEGIQPSSIAGIGSAEFTNEDNTALVECLKGIGAKDFYYHVKEVSNPSHDDFLISADKNPNRAGVVALGMKPVAADKRYRGFVVLGGVPEKILQPLSFERNRKVALFATHREPEYEYADLIFPVAAWAETEGNFANRHGRMQKIHAAFPPPGEAKAAWEIFELIGSNGWLGSGAHDARNL